jgi:hypothetical protein
VVQTLPAVVDVAAVEPCPSDETVVPNVPQGFVFAAGDAGLLDSIGSADGGRREAKWTAHHVGRPAGAGGLNAAPAKLSPSDPDHGGAPASAPQREPEPSAPPAPVPTSSSSCSSAGGGSSASSGQSKRGVRTGLPYCVLPPDTGAIACAPAVVETAAIVDPVRSTADEPGFAPD